MIKERKENGRYAKLGVPLHDKCFLLQNSPPLCHVDKDTSMFFHANFARKPLSIFVPNSSISVLVMFCHLCALSPNNVFLCFRSFPPLLIILTNTFLCTCMQTSACKCMETFSQLFLYLIQAFVTWYVFAKCRYIKNIGTASLILVSYLDTYPP